MKLLVSCLFFLVLICNLMAADFPLRAKFPKVPFISTEDLNKEYATINIVDVRSKFEYDVIHIKKAVHIPLPKESAEAEFALKIAGLKGKVAFYCNGHTCAKSYEAVVIVQKKGNKDTYVYDDGIFEWTKKYPKEAVLLGQSPVDPSKLISSESFKSKFLSKEKFAVDSVKEKAFLIDARDEVQRKKTPDFAKSAALFPMDELVKVLDKPHFKGRAKGKTLYIFDAVGKQVQWLQYHLEKNGYKDYFFLEEGVWSFFGAEGASCVGGKC